MNKIAKNPGCRRGCRLVRESGFLIEEGCPMHDREGYTPFVVLWFAGRPVLISTLALSDDFEEEKRHSHTLVASFLMALN